MKHKKFEKRINAAYRSFNTEIKAMLIGYNEENRSLLFKVKVVPGTKVADVFKYAQDIRSCLEIPVFRPFMKNDQILLLVSLSEISLNKLLPIMNSNQFRYSDMDLPVAIGYDELGQPVIQDFARIEHALYVGSTSSGKSTGLISMLVCLTMIHPASNVNFIIFDIGATSLSEFEDIPHLSYPIVKDKLTGVYVLGELVKEMERRIMLPADELSSLPFLFCVIDEYTSLISNLEDKSLTDRYKNALNNLLRRGRKARIHMVLATQNATQEAMQSDIVNITTRFVFRLTSAQSSKAVIGSTGAEQLPGKGAMLYKSNKMTEPMRLQGTYITDEELHALLEKFKSLNPKSTGRFSIPVKNYTEDYFSEAIEAIHDEKLSADNNTLELSKIILWTMAQQTISANSMKKQFNIGNRANDIMGRLFSLGLKSDKNGNKPRNVLSQSPDDISEETLEILHSNSVSDETIDNAFSNRQ